LVAGIDVGGLLDVLEDRAGKRAVLVCKLAANPLIRCAAFQCDSAEKHRLGQRESLFVLLAGQFFKIVGISQ
jgi:hypothetical protein